MLTSQSECGGNRNQDRGILGGVAEAQGTINWYVISAGWQHCSWWRFEISGRF